MTIVGIVGTAFAFIPALAVTSVLNTLAFQMPAAGMRRRFRPTCTRCGRSMRLHESVAIIAYLSQNGRCSHCGARAGLRAPFLELGAGFLCIACFARFGISGRGLVASLFCAVLLVIAASDLERRIIPNVVVVPAGIFILLANMVVAPDRWAELLIAAAGTATAFLVVALVYRGALGMGDVKLAFLLGAGLGSHVVPALLVGLLAAAAVGVFLIMRGGLSARKETIPLGPFLALGAIVALLA
jgi:prepilin signal peptidase PulO-like enzyme (type II secretory pathway)